MKFQKALILSVDEVREQLVQFFADVAADRAAVVDALREGIFDKLIPNLKALTDLEAVNLHGELCVGDAFIANAVVEGAEAEKPDLLLAQVNDERFEFLACREQGVAPKATPADISHALNKVLGEGEHEVVVDDLLENVNQD